ncbi:SDR family NAD(P)-dependent oxidoreductase [Phytoactinopolyspora mesophila]|uniref:SDR family NAD(P)-dependent oxidoreductase n=1 Tax=Phytoactinopolyspora mesophila TaxID=2650750 RepID=A0A7K3M5D1_9ACTN|nr:SDR family NAD(P)-dependent oxidoreductase [Phytoactinopolyspora mesophila]NDL58420.1 SDR family NAD(P)-dependent oxidoreductase [Phytoactinopolyspora mesophila]
MNSTHLNKLSGKIAFVTGGGRGIGAAVAARLAADGADVAITYLNDKDSATAVVDAIRERGGRAVALHVDSSDAAGLVDAVNQAAGELGGLDILINNAALYPVVPMADAGLEELDRTLSANVRGPFIAAQAAAAHMAEGGRIINIGSNVVEYLPFPGHSLYAMSKTALVGMTKGMARDLGPRGITVNLVNPGLKPPRLRPATRALQGTLCRTQSASASTMRAAVRRSHHVD